MESQSRIPYNQEHRDGVGVSTKGKSVQLLHTVDVLKTKIKSSLYCVAKSV